MLIAEAKPCCVPEPAPRVSEAHVLTVESSYSRKAGTVILLKLEMKETQFPGAHGGGSQPLFSPKVWGVKVSTSLFSFFLNNYINFCPFNHHYWNVLVSEK